MSKQEMEPESDGRRQRSERSRQSILDAMLALIDDGILVPTAQQVSERAGVGIRSVFRHFSDMESLFVSADDQIREQHRSLFTGGDREGTLEERLQHAIEQHALVYETVGNVFLSTRGQMWRYQVLFEQYTRGQREFRSDLDRWLPELKELPPEQREMVDVVASFETWNRLRVIQNLSSKASVKLVANMLRRVLSDD
jgi:AcrR family transcriptional regulator